MPGSFWRRVLTGDYASSFLLVNARFHAVLLGIFSIGEIMIALRL